MKLSCGTVIRQNDGSQDELVRLYNELVSDNAPGINYSNFSRYLEEHEDGDEFENDDDDDNGYGNGYDDATAHDTQEDGGNVNDQRNVSFSLDVPLEKLQHNKKNKHQKFSTGNKHLTLQISCMRVSFPVMSCRVL